MISNELRQAFYECHGYPISEIPQKIREMRKSKQDEVKEYYRKLDENIDRLLAPKTITEEEYWRKVEEACDRLLAYGNKSRSLG